MPQIVAVPSLTQGDWDTIKEFVTRTLEDAEVVNQLRAKAGGYDMTDATPGIDAVAQIDKDIRALHEQPWRRHGGQLVINNAGAFVRLAALARTLPDDVRPAQLPSDKVTGPLLEFIGKRPVPAQRAA